MNLYDKDEMAMEAELAIELAKQNNNFGQVRKEYLTDTVYLGICAVEEINNNEGVTKIKRISPESLVVGNSKSEDFKDISHAGYVENITFAAYKIIPHEASSIYPVFYFHLFFFFFTNKNHW